MDAMAATVSDRAKLARLPNPLQDARQYLGIIKNQLLKICADCFAVRLDFGEFRFSCDHHPFTHGQPNQRFSEFSSHAKATGASVSVDRCGDRGLLRPSRSALPPSGRA